MESEVKGLVCVRLSDHDLEMAVQRLLCLRLETYKADPPTFRQAVANWLQGIMERIANDPEPFATGRELIGGKFLDHLATARTTREN